MNNYPGNPAQFQSFFILFLTIIFLRFHQKWDWLGYTSSLLKVTYLSMALSPNSMDESLFSLFTWNFL